MTNKCPLSDPMNTPMRSTLSVRTPDSGLKSNLFKCKITKIFGKSHKNFLVIFRCFGAEVGVDVLYLPTFAIRLCADGKGCGYMNWLKRKEKGIQTSTGEKKEVPDGLWYKTPGGKIVRHKELEENAFVCPDDGFHLRIGSKEYFALLFDKGFRELDPDMTSSDPLHFVDSKPYAERLKATMQKTGLKDAVRTAFGTVGSFSMVVACMDFTFIGGSMGSVVGEKLCRAAVYAHKQKCPLLIICKSGGARMMESSFSLMQLPKVISKLIPLHQAKIPYFTLLTDPTTGGVSASFGMLGDINMAEPGALIGFAGPRVIRETIGKDLPKNFQRAESVQENGFVDLIVDRRKLKETLVRLITLFQH